MPMIVIVLTANRSVHISFSMPSCEACGVFMFVTMWLLASVTLVPVTAYSSFMPAA